MLGPVAEGGCGVNHIGGTLFLIHPLKIISACLPYKIHVDPSHFSHGTRLVKKTTHFRRRRIVTAKIRVLLMPATVEEGEMKANARDMINISVSCLHA